MTKEIIYQPTEAGDILYFNGTIAVALESHDGTDNYSIDVQVPGENRTWPSSPSAHLNLSQGEDAETLRKLQSLSNSDRLKHVKEWLCKHAANAASS